MNLPANRPANPVASFSKFLDSYKSQMALALPKHLNPDRMARLALTAFSSSPALQECTPQSIIGSLMTAASLGLEPGINGQGYLIPYKTTCTFVPGWKGLVDIANRSGRCTVWTGAVFDGDEFDYALGDSPFIRHKPGDEDDPAKLLYVYSVGRVKGSEWAVIEVWPIEKVRRHRDKYNKVGAKHYSFRDWEMYARKVPLLQVLKYMPQSIELANAIEATHAAEEGRAVVIDAASKFMTVGDAPEGDDPQDGGAGSGNGAGNGEQARTLPPLTPEDLAKKATSLKKAIANGQPVNDVIAALETKNTVSEEQRMEIASWAVKPTTSEGQQ